MPTGSSVVTVCPETGVSLPECSCGRCIEAQVREHQPHLLAAGAISRITPAPAAGSPANRSLQARRRAA